LNQVTNPKKSSPAPVKNIPKKIPKPTISIPVQPEMTSVTRKVLIKQIVLTKPDDFITLHRNLLDGNIMVANLQPFVNESKDPNAFRGKINWLKQYCIQNGGSVAKLKDYLFVITPNKHFKIESNLSKH
jgi:SepF-like predicted cell division protein (DUF552 family)